VERVLIPQVNAVSSRPEPPTQAGTSDDMVRPASGDALCPLDIAHYVVYAWKPALREALYVKRLRACRSGSWLIVADGFVFGIRREEALQRDF
jgi:hypothetical protein